jgi:HEAT repeat protein
MSTHLDYLIDALQDDRWEVRQWAAYSIGLISKNKEAQNSLKDALNDVSVHVQYAAIVACGDSGSKQLVNTLLSKLNQNDLLLKTAAIKALGNIGSRKSIEPLINLYEKEDFYIRTEIVLALGRIGGSSKIYRILKSALLDDDLHKYALIALQLIGTNESKKILGEQE